MAWDQLLEQSGSQCLLGDLHGTWRVNVIVGCCVTLMLVMKPALSMTLFLEVLLDSESQLPSKLSRSISSLKYRGMRMRLEGVVFILDSSAETLISAVSSLMHAVLGPKTHLNYALSSSKSEAFVLKKCSIISEASLCLWKQVTKAR